MSTYSIFNIQTLLPYVSGLPDLVERLGGSADQWTIEEIGDGNLNLVFLVRGPDTSVIIKQGAARA